MAIIFAKKTRDIPTRIRGYSQQWIPGRAYENRFYKSESHDKKWNEWFWFSTNIQSRDKYLDLAFYGESQVIDGCTFTYPGSIGYYCFEYITQGKGTLIDADNSRYPLTPGTLYLLYPGRKSRIMVPSGQGMQKIMLGFSNGALMQLMLYHLRIREGDTIQLPQESEAIQQFKEIGKMVKKETVIEDLLSAECYRFLLKLFEEQENYPRESLSSICEYMQNHLQSSLSLDVLAQKARMSKPTFIRKFRQQFSCTPIRYLISLRLEYAKTLLQLQRMSVREVAFLCGYRNVKFFSREYHRHFGVPPSAQ